MFLLESFHLPFNTFCALCQRTEEIESKNVYKENGELHNQSHFINYG